MKIGLLGCGNVGSALAHLIDSDAKLLRDRADVEFQLAKVAVRNLGKTRPQLIDRTIVTADPFEVVNDPSIDVVVELIGGVDPARELVLAALDNGKPVVTGNKELLARHWNELFELASLRKVDLLYEAAVAGAIPLVRSLRESLAGDRITSVMGIVNGTTNYILTSMTEKGESYEDALRQAQGLGFAEADPTFDVEGYDSASKASIIATIAFGKVVTRDDVNVEGIVGIDAQDLTIVDKLGYCVKLLAVAHVEPDGAISARVFPAMLRKDHPLSGVRGSFNAVFLQGESVGEMMLYGRGAGGLPTAAAVLGDLVDVAHNLSSGTSGRIKLSSNAKLVEYETLKYQYFVAIDVDDRPGVLAQVAEIFGDNNVSIRSMEQLGLGSEAHLVFLTHLAQESSIHATLSSLQQVKSVKKVGRLLRVINGMD